MRLDVNTHPAGVIRPVNPSDPRGLNHPAHRERWLEYARSIGRAMADQAFEKHQRELAAKETAPP